MTTQTAHSGQPVVDGLRPGLAKRLIDAQSTLVELTHRAGELKAILQGAKPISSVPVIDQAGTILSDSTALITITDTNGQEGWQYDIGYRSSDDEEETDYVFTGSPKDHGESLEFTLTDLPVDGRVIELQLKYGPTLMLTVDAVVTAYSAPVRFVTEPFWRNVTSSTAEIAFTTNVNAQAFLETSPDGTTWATAKTEESFKYSSHNMRLTALAPETLYYFRVHVVNENGSGRTSGVNQFTTDLAAATSPDQNYANGGDIVGPSLIGCYQTGNNQPFNHQMMQIRAQKTGFLRYAGSHKRYPVRAEGVYVPGESVVNHWKFKSLCGDNQLEQAACGIYTRSYSGGNPRFVIKCYPMASDGVPDYANLLGTTNEFRPQQFSDYTFFRAEFAPWPYLTKGETYCYVMENHDPLPNSFFSMTQLKNQGSSGLALARQYAAQGLGYISLNGLAGAPVVNGPTFGAYAGSAGFKCFGRNSLNDDWRHNTGFTGTHAPYWANEYDDGQVFGNVLDRTGTGSIVNIEGSTRARQRIVADRNVTVDGVALWHSHSGDANGHPMSVELKDSSGVVMSTATVPRDNALRNIVDNASSYFRRNSMSFARAKFSDATLVQGQVYYVELSAPAGAGFRVVPYHKHASYKYGDVTDIPSGIRCEYTTGSTWGNFPTRGQADMMQLGLEVKGVAYP